MVRPDPHLCPIWCCAGHGERCVTRHWPGAYRTYAGQRSLFQERYVKSDTGGSSKVWNNTRYWLKQGMAMAAVPRTSNHGWGCAVDVALGGDGNAATAVGVPVLSWAIGHALQYG